MYYHARVLLLDKPALYNAIRETFSTPLCGPWRIPIASYTDFNTADNIILSQHQRDQLLKSQRDLRNENTFGISSMMNSIFPGQLMLYTNNCMTRETVHRILAGENPE